MWSPKSVAFINYSKLVASEFIERWSKGEKSRTVVLDLAKKHGVSDTQIYRYLKFVGVTFPKLPRKRDNTGKFVK